MRKLAIAILVTATLSAPAAGQIYDNTKEPGPTPFASVSFDTCARIFSHQNYVAESAWIGGYLTAASVAARGSFKTEGGMRSIFRSVEIACSNLPPDTLLVEVMQRLVPIQTVE